MHRKQLQQQVREALQNRCPVHFDKGSFAVTLSTHPASKPKRDEVKEILSRLGCEPLGQDESTYTIVRRYAYPAAA